MTTPVPPTPVKVLDTFLRGLERLSRLTGELTALDEEVAGREAEALGQVLDQVRPLLPKLVKPVALREPWKGERGDPRVAEGVVLRQSFQQDRAEGGKHTHHAELLLLDRDGRLVDVTAVGSWTEGAGGAVTDARWNVESREQRLTPEAGKRLLRPALTGLLDALRDAIVRVRADRDELRRRLDLLTEVDALLRRGASSP